MKGDQRHRLEQRARKEMDHARRQVDLFRDRLTMRGSDPVTASAYRQALEFYDEKLRVFEALALQEA